MSPTFYLADSPLACSPLPTVLPRRAPLPLPRRDRSTSLCAFAGSAGCSWATVNPNEQTLRQLHWTSRTEPSSPPSQSGGMPLRCGHGPAGASAQPPAGIMADPRAPGAQFPRLLSSRCRNIPGGGKAKAHVFLDVEMEEVVRPAAGHELRAGWGSKVVTTIGPSVSVWRGQLRLAQSRRRVAPARCPAAPAASAAPPARRRPRAPHP